MKGTDLLVEPGLAAQVDLLRREVLAAQAPSGAFASRVVLDRASGRSETDENLFVTALVVHHLGEVEPCLATVPDCARGVRGAIERGLDFVETCRMDGPRVHPRSRRARRPPAWGEEVAGAFRFYPPGRRPDWMQTPLAADVDDTALALGVLLDAGRIAPDDALEVVDRVIDPHRVHDPARGARWPWAVTGAVLTWIDPRLKLNPVDCTVNVNLAALLARLDRPDHPAFAAALATVERGVAWAADNAERARALSPFYPDPAELARAVERATGAGPVGADAFAPLAASLAELPWASADRRLGGPPERPVCGSTDGRVLWWAPALQAVRRVASEAAEAAASIDDVDDVDDIDDRQFHPIFNHPQRLFRQERET